MVYDPNTKIYLGHIPLAWAGLEAFGAQNMQGGITI